MDVELDQLTKMTTSSRGGNPSPNKKEVCAKVLEQLADIGHESVVKPGFSEDLQAHFNRLPTRYFDILLSS